VQAVWHGICSSGCMNATIAPSDAYFDLQDLASLRARARRDDPEALRAAARQFESLFIRMMLKSMREASLGDPLMEGEGSAFYRDLFDQQLALDMARQGGLGLADALVRQLTRARQAPADRLGGHALPARRSETAAAPPQVDEEAVHRGDPRAFVDQLMPLARRAAGRLGVAPEVLVAQAALETGWGRYVIRDERGRSSHNLFNIKAGGGWDGPTVRKRTLEYADGVARMERAAFRAYPDFAASFQDYVEFIAGRPRYREALAQAGDPAGYLRALAQAGYATDPRYADKILAILEREPVLKARGERPIRDEQGHSPRG